VEINAPYLEPPSRLPFAGIPRIWDAPLTGGQRESFERLTAAEVEQERRELREWRMSTSPTYFAAFAERLRQASLQPFSYVMTFTPDMTDAEIEAIFGHAKGLGVNVFSTNQTKVEMASRLAPFADRYFVDIGFHNHTATGNPNEAASRTSLERILSVSRRMMVNLDVGHYVASNQDVMAFARDHFDRISHFHMKDRKRNEGPGVPFGEGDAPIAELLTLLHERRSAKPAIVEYEYLGTGSAVEETTRSIAYLKALLEKIAASEH
jgi:sugar phosphate isomerase/epimerase